MDKKDLHIILSADDPYAQHLGVALLSLLSNHRDGIFRLVINILDGGLTPESKERLAAIASRYPAKIIYWPIDNGLFETCPEIGHLKLPTYYRLLIPEIIPPDIERAIYLDSDLVVVGEISELAGADLAGRTVGAIREVSQEEVLAAWSSEGLTRYFNAGVLLIDLARWRKEKISQKTFAFIAANAGRLHWADQDALNLVLKEDWQELDKSFNLQIGRNQKKIRGVDPIIIHYVGRLKPWNFLYYNYYRKYYWRYLKLTPWRDYRYPDFNYYAALKRLIKLIPGAVSLRLKIIKWLKD